MFTSTYVNLRYWFYPTGNTPAVNLLRDFPTPESINSDIDGKIRLLLLGCGDPRDILFSLWCEDNQKGQRSYDFTCCDVDAAVLARNAVLFGLIADEEDPMTLWDIFYHLFVPESCLQTLQKQAYSLLQASESSESWRSSKYGKFLKFLDNSTMRQLRKYWSLYSSIIDSTTEDHQDTDQRARAAVRETYNRHIGTGVSGSGFRSAGPLWMHALPVMSAAHKGFWKTGVVGGNLEDQARLGNLGKGYVNPMFTVSSSPTKNFAVHYGTDPLLGFNLAEAFQAPEGDDKPTISAVVELAKLYFSRWCCSCLENLKASAVVVRLFCGEAVRFGHHIQCLSKGTQPLFTHRAPWSFQPLHLDELVDDGAHEFSSPLLFDVIDTSNLVDHVGLLNVLSATTSLLRENATSVLYTESLLRSSEDVVSSLKELLYTDVVTFSILLGLAPAGCFTGITTEAVVNEAASFVLAKQATTRQQQFRMRVPWVYPDAFRHGTANGDDHQLHDHQVALNATVLADIFFKMYLKMFKYEDLSSLMSHAMRQQTSPLGTDLRHYTRASLAAVIQMALKRVQTDRVACLELFLLKIELDRTMILGSNNFQELCVYFHLLGVFTTEALKCDPRDVHPGSNVLGNFTTRDMGMMVQASLPSLVHVILVVPRARLSVFTQQSPDTIGTPGLHLSIRQNHPLSAYENQFFALHLFFGKVFEVDSHGIATYETDSLGWTGNADLIVTCCVSAFTLFQGPRNGLSVALCVNTSPSSTAMFAKSLGLGMKVFEATFDQPTRLFVQKEAPGFVGYKRTTVELMQSASHSDPSPVICEVLLTSALQATRLKAKVQIEKTSNQGKSLSSGAPVFVKQDGLCRLGLHVGLHSPINVSYPFSVDATGVNIKISRKSFWVEISAAILNTLSPGGSLIRSSTRNSCSHGRFSTWSIARANLKRQPIVQTPEGASFDWLTMLMGLTKSDSEMDQSRRSAIDTAKIDLKESLQSIFLSFVGAHQSYGLVNTYMLNNKNRGGVHTIIFATTLRHDLDAGSVTLEAYVVPLTNAIGWKPFAEHATRIALSPLFPVPYIESSVAKLREVSDGIGALGTTEKCSQCGKAKEGLKKCGLEGPQEDLQAVNCVSGLPAVCDEDHKKYHETSQALSIQDSNLLKLIRAFRNYFSVQSEWIQIFFETLVVKHLQEP
ncbi:MAG: hypothetical protein M1833_003536 [Piccolia ochrophora]|nr:MAG: hypothetical protein M1833_003536 [Piccolia ochrophora]